MMVLATHQLQGSYGYLPSVPSFWIRGNKLKHFVPSLLAIGRKDRYISLKCESYLSLAASHSLRPKSKLFKISAFKGSVRHDDSGSIENGSKSLKNSVKVSYLQHESEKSSKVQNGVPAPYEDETRTRSVAIQKLFKNWMMLLRTPSKIQRAEEVLEEPSVMETSEIQNTKQIQERGEISKSVLSYFLGLDATIKIPLLVLTPLCLAVNHIYGSEVSKELTPLWILGPLVVALYIKIFNAICGLYLFTFKQTVKVVKNLPDYYCLAHNYVLHGKLKEGIRTHLWLHVDDIETMDYNEFTRTKLKDLQVWLVERYLDFVESIWPYYCRIIRFLKRANLI